jgi:hypothetical protein
MWDDKRPVTFLVDRPHNKPTRHKFILLKHKAEQINSPSILHSRTNNELQYRPDRHVHRSHHNLPHRVKWTESKSQWRHYNKKRTEPYWVLGKYTVFYPVQKQKNKRGHNSVNYRQVTVLVCNLCSVLMHCRQGTDTFSNTLVCMFALQKATHCGMLGRNFKCFEKRKSPSKANRPKSIYSNESFSHLCTVM